MPTHTVTLQRVIRAKPDRTQDHAENCSSQLRGELSIPLLTAGLGAAWAAGAAAGRRPVAG